MAPNKGCHRKWLLSGLLFGYPECCILDFCSRELAPKEKRLFHGSGYIPCPKCNQKSEKELLEFIKENRIHSKPFPWDGVQ